MTYPNYVFPDDPEPEHLFHCVGLLQGRRCFMYFRTPRPSVEEPWRYEVIFIKRFEGDVEDEQSTSTMFPNWRVLV